MRYLVTSKEHGKHLLASRGSAEAYIRTLIKEGVAYSVEQW